MRNQVFKKLFSVLLALIMVAGLLPASVLAEGEGNADSTPAPTEAVQPTESAEPTAPTETEAPEVTEVPTPTPENPATTVEPTQGEPTAEPTDEGIMSANVMPVQAETEINYVTKPNSVPLPDGTFYRIVHLDCGRKYFSEAQIKQIIDYAYNYGYTHVELAFGNDGLRFLLNDMEVSANGTTYTSEEVTSAIKAGNKAFYDAGTNELSEEEMGRIIAYAKGKGIGIIPMFDAPGHLQTVIRAMMTLGITFTECTTFTIGGKEYSIPTTSGSSENWAINPTYAEGVNFVQALMQKYITYFAGKGCTMFNIAADECGFTSMSTETYTAYARLVNSMAAMVQNAGMTALAFNDGIYHNNLTTNVEFDTNIAVCYWDATTTKYAPAATLAEKGFKIINTHNKWYYVIGAQDNGWYGATWSIKNMNGTGASDYKADKCDFTDGGYQTKYGCMNAIWCDTPSNGTNMTTIEEHIKALSVVEYNKTFFNQVEAPKTPAVTVSDENKTVKEVTKAADNTYKVVLKKATGGTAESQTLQLNVANGAEGATYTWTSNNTDVATVENGLVTFKGAAGIVTITATPVAAATRSINETAAYSITFNVTKEGEVAEETIEVAVGKTETVIIKGENLARDEGYTTDDPSIATVKVTGVNAGESTTEYKPANNVKVINIANNNGNYLSTIYFYLKDDAYYPLFVTRSYSNYTYTNYTYTYYYKDKSGKYQKIGDQTVNYRSLNTTNCNIPLYNATPTTATETSTTIEFTGLKEDQTTYVTIGNIRYKIVVKADVTNAPKLPVQLWITNVGIQVDGITSTTGANYGSKSSHYVSVAADNAYGLNGVPLSELVPSTITDHKEYDGTWWDNTYQGQHSDYFTDKTAYNLILAKGTKFTSGNYQMVWGDNQYASGADFKYVRYYNSAWWVSIDNTDETNWVKVTDASVNGTGTQVVAYYMQETKVTNEVTTYVVDWGNAVPDKTAGVIVDYSVKYSDGTQIPKKSEFPKKDKTMFFRMIKDSDTVRRIYDIRALETTNREVYMITVTPNSDVSTDTITLVKDKLPPQYSYNGTEKVAWVKDESDLPVEFQDESTHYTSINGLIKYTVGGEPTIKGVEIYENQAMLVTYYLRDKVTQDTLYVHYIDKTADKEFYQYTITVEKNTFFDEKINKKADPNWKDYLDYGTVKNDLGVDITVSADLGTMPKIGAEYRYADYYCESVKWEEPGKHVYLYYTFKYNVTFVVDFGLPLVITPDKVNASLGAANITSTIIKQASYYADIEVVDIKNVVYKLNSTIDGEDNFTVTYKGTNLQVEGQPEGSVTYTIRIIPATSVYYEDSFAKFYGSDGTQQTVFNPTSAGDVAGTWYVAKDTSADNNANTNQALEVLGTKENVYGYDRAYQNSTMFSMGSARKVTVTSTMATTGVVWPTAQFTFKGTGFDIISLTNNTSGAIFVDVTRKVNGEEVKERSVFVDNYYGYSYENGTWKAEPNNPNAIYQVPVIKVSGLDYDEHKVVIKVAYNTFFDDANAGSYSFWLDAVRVYDPAGNTLDNDYVKDREVKPIYVEVRKALIGQDGFTPNGSGLTNGAVFIDGKSTGASIDDYKNFGPNHEVYLARDQAIAFRIVADRIPATVQIGVKLANGSNGALKISDASGRTLKFAKYNGSNGDVVENDTLTLSTATDMYYALNGITWESDAGKLKSNVIVLTNTRSDIVSITNVKCTYESITENTTNAVTLAISYDDALMAVDAVNNAITPVEPEPEPEPEPEKTFEPERFEASWSRNVMQGRKATLTVKTSEDVEAITVDGQTIRSYRTRTERVGFGRRAKRITYREFTYSMVAQESADFSVTAINAEGTESEAITARLTVKTRPNSMRDMWDWFKGWF